MKGLNTSPISQIPYNTCSVCVLTAIAQCRDRSRIYRIDDVDRAVMVGQDATLYTGGDAASVICASCQGLLLDCADLAANSARVLLFVDDGDVYARIANGRVDQTITIVATITLTSGALRHVNLKIIVER